MSERNPSKPESSKTLWQAVKFTLFSASAGILQIASFELLSAVAPFPYWLSYGIALVLSVLWNFTFNRRYTFRSDMNVPRAMSLVLLFYAVFTPLSMWLGQMIVNQQGNETLVNLGTMLVNFVTEYLYQKFVVYRKTIDTNDVAQRAKARKA